VLAGLVAFVPPRAAERSLDGGGGARLAALPAATPTLAAPPDIGDDPRSTLLAAVARQQAKRGWRLRQTVTAEGGSYVQTLSYAAPDRYRLFQPDLSEVVAVGEQSWRRDGAVWRESRWAGQVARAAADEVRRGAQLERALAEAVPIERLPDEWTTGERARVLHYLLPPPLEGGQHPTDVTWWVRERDGLPVRLRVATSFRGRKTTSVHDIDYRPDIVVELPTDQVLPEATLDISAADGLHGDQWPAAPAAPTQDPAIERLTP
jgi:hypothetical protein